MRRLAEDYPFYDISGPIAIVHRGGNAAGRGTENTVEAFWTASQRGILYGEADICGTIDRKAPVIHGTRNPLAARHEKNVLRSWIARHTYQELLDKPGFEDTPLLEEVLRDVPKMRFFVDIKTPEAIEPAAKAISGAGAIDRVSIGTANYEYVRAVADLLGGQEKVCTGIESLGTLSLKASDINAYRILEESGVTSLQPDERTIDGEMVERLRELGIHVIVWSGKNIKNDNPEYMRRALGKGVHGLMSFHTNEMIEVFRSHDPQKASINA